MDASFSGYDEHLTDADLRLLSTATELPEDADLTDPALLEGLLADPRVFEAIFSPSGEVVLVSPFLAFGVAVHRAAGDLAPEVRDFLGTAQRRLFLAELLASFTRVAAGRSRTRRFSELDPVRLAGLLEVSPEESWPGIYRRLGDVSLFLSGVFPAYSALHALGPVDAAQLLRAARVPAADRDGLETATSLDLLEYLGARWYRAALATAPVRTAPLDVVGEVAGRFRQARRVLNHLADRYLTGPDSPWFPRPGTGLTLIHPGTDDRGRSAPHRADQRLPA